STPTASGSARHGPPSGSSEASWSAMTMIFPADGLKNVRESLFATVATWTLSASACCVIRDHPVHIPRAGEWSPSPPPRLLSAFVQLAGSTLDHPVRM